MIHWIVTHQWTISAVLCAFAVGWICGLVEADNNPRENRKIEG